MKWKLTKWQKEIVEQGKKILEDNRMLYLALFPRSGKSLIVMDIIDKVYANPKVLFVTTKSALAGIKKTYRHLDMTFDMTLVNYESLHKIPEDKYTVVVLDEAHSKISKFPKPSKSRKELDRLVGNADVIWMSGTPKIESNSKLYHQISVCDHHTWSSYNNFYRWHDEFGIKGLTIYTGGPRPAVDYSQTVDLTPDIEYFMIKSAKSAIDAFKLHKVVIDTPDYLKAIYDQMKRDKLVELKGNVSVADGGAALQNKLLQISGGTLIMEDEAKEHISDYKVKYCAKHFRDAVIFYKFQAEYEMLRVHFPDEQLYQIDAAATGLDLSHFDKAVIYTPTYSGSNFTQVLNRLCNVNREEQPEIYLLLSELGADKKCAKEALEKYDSNLKYLLGD